MPLMKTSMKLQIPIALINPSLDEMQNCFTQVLNNIVETHKYISLWGSKKATLVEPDKIKPKNYHKFVSENKEVIRINMSLQGVMFLLQPDVTALLKVNNCILEKMKNLTHFFNFL